VAAALVASVLVNGALLAAARFAFSHPAGGPRRAVEVAPLSPSAWEANRAIRDAAPADPAKRGPTPADPAKRAAEILAELERAKPPEPAPSRVPPGQVVEVDPSPSSTPPKDARFASDRDQSVEKETIARRRQGPAGAAAGKGTRNAGEQPAPPPVARGTRGAAERASGERGRDGAARDDRLALQLDRFGDRMARSGDSRPEGDPVAPDGAPAGPTQRGAPGPLGPSRLAPSAETYERIAGGGSLDHVSGVEEGDATYLNTREWKYATYFNRMKQALANTWDPSTALAQRDPDGRRFAYRDRHTVLAVRLDETGSVLHLEVVKSSGVDFLDQIAVDAFRRAQPFTNPPRGLADARGQIEFTFGFYLETGGGFRMYRAPTR
jgi:TonB family protein